MTFTGVPPSIAWPLLGAAAALAAWLFLRKVRPPRVAVSSLLLWHRVIDETRPLSYWQRVRRAVSLAITMLIAIALGVAFARPVIGVGRAGGRVLLVMDSSLSLGARTADGATRWVHAVADAKREAAGAGEVLLASTADGIVEGPTTDLALIDTALDAMRPSAADSGEWPSPTDPGTTHFFTDGAIARRLDQSVIVHSVFEPAANAGITAFATRPATSATSRPEVYLEVFRTGVGTGPVRVTVTRAATVIFDERVPLASGARFRQVLSLDAAGSPRLLARVSMPLDALEVDNEAVAWIDEADTVAVEVVTEHPGLLGRLLQRDPGLRVTTVAPAAYDPRAADVVVFDRWVPSNAPDRPALVVLPPDIPWLGSHGADARQPVLVPLIDHPVLAGVELSTLDVRHARGSVGPDLAPVVVSADESPVLSVRDRADSRLVVVGFAPEDANVDSAPAFPVLIGNALEWLARPRMAAPGPPGPRVLPRSTTRVIAPDGHAVALVPAGSTRLARLNAPGLYLAEIGGARSVIAVTVSNPAVSDLSATQLPAPAGAPALSRITRGRSAWWLVTWVALVLVLIEWWTWHRRITV